MALETNEYFASASQAGTAAIIPHEGGVRPVTFDGDGAGDELAVGTPVAFDTSVGFWLVWDNANANGGDEIRGFVYPNPIQLHATDEVVGQVLLDGEIAYESIVLPTGQTENNLKAALRVGPRELGLKIDGLDGVR